MPLSSPSLQTTLKTRSTSCTAKASTSPATSPSAPWSRGATMPVPSRLPVVGNSWNDWQGEKFLDITQHSVRGLMEARVEKAARMSCDAVEPDNMSNWNQEGTGLTISRDEPVTYNKYQNRKAVTFLQFFSDFGSLFWVREHGMHVGMKNAIELLGDLSDYYDFGINESCHVWKECGAYKIPFTDKDKPVFNVECDADYGICDEANGERLDTIFKEYDLNAAMCSCANASRNVDCSDVTG
ncbi:unnamed protein product [Ectocarpus sp. 13 AM-2016]